MAVYVTSADGTKIWAEATGNPAKPAVVFIPGLSFTSLVFERQWASPFMKANLFMVRDVYLPAPAVRSLSLSPWSLFSSVRPSDQIRCLRYNRSDTTSVVRESATSHWSRLPTGPNSMHKISRLSLITLESGRRSQSWLDGAFGSGHYPVLR